MFLWVGLTLGIPRTGSEGQRGHPVRTEGYGPDFAPMLKRGRCRLSGLDVIRPYRSVVTAPERGFVRARRELDMLIPVLGWKSEEAGHGPVRRELP